MRQLFSFSHSLTTKLVLAFILVAVPPMLIASELAATMVHNAVNINIERWLKGASEYISTVVEDTMAELDAVYTLMQSRFMEEHIGFNSQELAAMAAMDADILLLRDENGTLLFASGPALAFTHDPLFPGSVFRWATLAAGQQELTLARQYALTGRDGSRRILDMASLFSLELSETGDETPLHLQILLPTATGFYQVYSSGPENIPELAPEILDTLASGADEVFIPDADWLDTSPNAHVLVKAVRDGEGNLVALFVLSVVMLPLLGSVPSSSLLFWGLFLLGTTVSGCMGYILAIRLSRPIQMLNKGVQSIASGNLEYRVAVSGKDEVAALSAGFNQMARQLEKMKQDNVQAARMERSRMLGEIALGFAHEIRNPLVVIKTSAELVHNGLAPDAREAKLMGLVVEEVGRIDKLISEFLAFAKPAGLQLEYFLLQPLLEEILEISAAELEKRNIVPSLIQEACADGVWAEKNRLRQVLFNLILNAMDAMPQGGTLCIRLYDAPGKNELCVDIQDTGVGIAEELLPTIHLPFISTKKHGLGLGLAQAYAIMDQHGGRITCASIPGEGTVFTLCLSTEGT